MGILKRNIGDFMSVELVEEALDRLPWKDFGKGLSMARLAREGAREIVVYRIRADADPKAFLKHEHIGGEFYLILKGGIEDETGTYQKGDLVFLDPHSVHTPRAIGETVVLVLWPAGVRIVE